MRLYSPTLLQNTALLSQMEQVLHGARADSTHLQTLLDDERTRTQEQAQELDSLRDQLGVKLSEWSAGQLENAQLRGEFQVVQGSMGSVEESMRRATETIRTLQQVGVVNRGCGLEGEVLGDP